MKNILLIICLLNHYDVFSQSTVTGFVEDREEGGLPGVNVLEIGTGNGTTTDLKGYFRLVTTQDSCVIGFSYIGYNKKNVTITKDTSLVIILENEFYDSRWLTIGLNYDFFNPTVGILFSNGYNEHPITHFEDFTESWIYKLYGSTDFGRNYSFGFKFAHDYAFRFMYMPAVEFRKFEYPSGNIHFTDMNLSTGLALRRFQPRLLFKTGFQSLNDNGGFGAGTGLQMEHSNIYYGFLIGYWVSYFTYEAYIQGFIYKHKISLRAQYERIERYNFLNFGVNYTFNR